MSRSRDIANFLGKTEIANTTNNALLNTASSVGLDSAQVLSIAGGLTVYATLDDLPTSGLTSGDQAFITATNRIYVSNGTGWYNVALFNATPTLTIDPSGAVTLAVDGSTPTVITLTGADSDNADVSLTYTVESDGSFANIATLSQDSSVFTITPLAEGVATPGSSTLTFKVSDGISFGSGTTVFTLTFGPDWSVGTPTETTAVSDPLVTPANLGYSIRLNSDGTQMIAAGLEYGVHYWTRSGSTWTSVQRIQPTLYSGTESYYGYASNMSSTDDFSYFAVGVPRETGATGIYEGSVRIYTRSGNTWTQQAKIQDNDQASNDRFGSGVDLNSDATYLVVGKRLDDTLGQDAGNIFVFTRSGSTWTQQQAITATVTGTAAADHFGWITKINSAGDFIAAAAPFQEGGGKVYTFTRSGSTWSQQQEFAGSDTVTSDSFGIQLDINGTGDLMAVIGNASESVYIFTKSGSTWTQQQQINKPGSGNLRGVSVSRNGDVIAITALDEATYVYQDVGGTWTLRKTLTPTGIASGDYYGEWSTHISQDGNWIAVGAPREDGPGNSVTNAGLMFAYNVGS
jgi:hypothetical protein